MRHNITLYVEMWTIIALQETDDEENEIHGLVKVTDVTSLYN